MEIHICFILWMLCAIFVHGQLQQGFISIDCGSSQYFYLDIDTGISYAGFISIDCGSSQNFTYQDPDTGIFYAPDEAFIDNKLMLS
ncbi:putative lrr receptor-like serine/threonine-protein kinase [Quercus suber]|uniref:Lrr receptor-like serine/threonine-protein kinase n=1 Tax=Quercus suber TaxID=58331 RepID=A0AAW0LZQ0_QUESU